MVRSTQRNIQGHTVARFDGAAWTTYNSSNSGLPDSSVLAIAIDRDGSKWFGTEGGGVAHFDGANWTVYTNAGCPVNCSGPQSNSIYSIAIQVMALSGLVLHSVWRSSMAQSGVYRLPYSANAVAVDGNDNKWFGNWSGEGVGALWGGNDYTLTENSHWLSNTQCAAPSTSPDLSHAARLLSASAVQRA